jgi:hypothetical protein
MLHTLLWIGAGIFGYLLVGGGLTSYWVAYQTKWLRFAEDYNTTQQLINQSVTLLWFTIAWPFIGMVVGLDRVWYGVEHAVDWWYARLTRNHVHALPPGNDKFAHMAEVEVEQLLLPPAI